MPIQPAKPEFGASVAHQYISPIVKPVETIAETLEKPDLVSTIRVDTVTPITISPEEIKAMAPIPTEDDVVPYKI